MTEFYFDTRTGDQLVGEAAIQQRVEESSPGDVVPLRNLLNMSEELPFDTKGFEKIRADELTKQDYILFGRWALKALEAPGQTRPRLTNDALERLYALGIGPHYNHYKVYADYDTLAEFQEAIEAPITYSPRGRFDHWMTRDFVEHARKVEAQAGRKPTLPDYNMAAEQSVDAPTEYIITKKMTLGELNEHLGYPDTRSWDDDDFIEYGCRVAETNGIEYLWMIPLMVLSSKNRGPGYATICRRYTAEQYKAAVTQRFEEKQAKRREKLDSYRRMIEAKVLPSSFSEFSEQQLLNRAARYLLVQNLAPNLPAAEKEKIASSASNKSFMSQLLRIHPGLTAGGAELRAARLEIVDDIWPDDTYKKYLKVTDSEIDELRAKRRKTHQDWDSRKKASS